jgi:hypothetical protein
MTDLLFYKKLVALNKDQHRHHSFKKFESLDFAAHTLSVLLTGSEFAEASKEYPIVFVKAADNSMMPFALLGLREGENLYIDASGKWNARYIPAYVRRYPFIFSEAGEEQFMVCVDEDCVGLNVAGEGESLFDEQGAASPFVNNMIQFMQDYQVDYLRTRAFMEQLQKLDLLKESNAKITLNNAEDFLINGLWMVDEAKLAALDDDKLLQLAKSGDLGRIYAHLISLSNLNQLAALEAQKKLLLSNEP